jgi:hypothetical protein
MLHTCTVPLLTALRDDAMFALPHLEGARRRARLPRSVRASRVIGRQKFIHFECLSPRPAVLCTAYTDIAASHSLSLPVFHQFKMSMAGSLPLKAAAPTRIVSASRQCQRRSIAQSSRAQPKRPSIAAAQQPRNAPSIRVCTPPSNCTALAAILTGCDVVLPRLALIACRIGSLQDARRRQERLGRRDQEGILRPREEIPSRHKQRAHGQGEVRCRAVRLRNPVRHREEEGLRLVRVCCL